MHKQLLLGCILGLSILPASTAIGASPAAQSSTRPLLENNEIEATNELTAELGQSLPGEASATADYETYVEPGKFSVDYPSGWRIERTDNRSVQITSYSPSADNDLTQTEDIKIQIWLIPEDPASVVDSALNEITQDGTLQNYRAVTVDGQPTLMLWLGGQSLDFPDAIHTYVGYGNQETAVIFSSYTASNPNAEVVIQRIHDSFNRQQQADSIEEE